MWAGAQELPAEGRVEKCPGQQQPLLRGWGRGAAGAHRRVALATKWVPSA